MSPEEFDDKYSPFSSKRLYKEFRTIEAMITIYCRDHQHNLNGHLCGTCIDILNYAERRLLKCPFKETKPTCGNCTIHCYNKKMRKKVIEVMRYAGPIMIFKHPIMAMQHLFDSKIKSTPLPQPKK